MREYNRQFEAKYWFKNLTLVDVLVTYTTPRKIDGIKVILILQTIIFFGDILVCSQQNCLTLKSIQISFHTDRYTINKYPSRLLPPSSQFRQFNTWSCKQFTPHPKDTNLHHHRCTNMHRHKPTFTVLSVTDTGTAFNCCCSFNWKRRTGGNFELSFITSALHTHELLGSHPGHFIPEETGQHILTTRLCGPQS